MKISVSIIILLFFGITNNVFAQEDEDSIACLDIKTIVGLKNRPIENAIVDVFLGNELIQETTTNDHGELHVVLMRNKIYTLVFMKDNLVDRMVSINTTMPILPNQEVYKFDCALDMMEGRKPRGNWDAFDFPYALVYFNEKAFHYEFDKKYTAAIKKEIKETQNFIAGKNKRNIERTDVDAIQALIDANP